MNTLLADTLPRSSDFGGMNFRTANKSEQSGITSKSIWPGNFNYSAQPYGGTEVQGVASAVQKLILDKMIYCVFSEDDGKSERFNIEYIVGGRAPLLILRANKHTQESIRLKYSNFDERARERILSFGNLETNWDGYDGIAPNQKAIEEAIALYNKLVGEGLVQENTKMSVIPVGDGEISFHWRNEKGMFDLGLFGDGEYSYYGKVRGSEYFGDNIKIDAPLSRELKSCLQELR